jgi:hypothetical protein
MPGQSYASFWLSAIVFAAALSAALFRTAIRRGRKKDVLLDFQQRFQ